MLTAKTPLFSVKSKKDLIFLESFLDMYYVVDAHCKTFSVKSKKDLKIFLDMYYVV